MPQAIIKCMCVATRMPYTGLSYAQCNGLYKYPPPHITGMYPPPHMACMYHMHNVTDCISIHESPTALLLYSLISRV
jgi:hypothetical protein